MNTSATGGYLRPEGGVVSNKDLEDIFHTLILGLTGIDELMIRPRFQISPPSIPAIGVDWIAFEIQSLTQDAGPYLEQNAENAKSIRHQDIELFLSFYGSHGQDLAQLFIDGAAIPQNISELDQYAIQFIDSSDIITAADLINTQYVRRFDVTARFRRKTARLYPIKTFKDFKINMN